MAASEMTPVTVLGLGEMGRVLAEALVDAGHPVTVWNRSPARAAPLADRGATVATTVADAVAASPLVVACLFDHASVHEVLDPVADRLRGRVVANVTTTAPDEARELGEWAAGHGIDLLDGGIMAVPEMIGKPGAAVFYSGPVAAFEAHRTVFDTWADSSYFGEDAGMASLYDLAMLSSMYVMFGGLMHGAAMVASEGVTASDFAARTIPFLGAILGSFAETADIIDRRDYAGPGQQSLEFSDLGKILRASSAQGVPPDVVVPVQALIERQVAAGHGHEGFARIFESLRSPATRPPVP
jgi:3-hydroxyisobutyrate dehydrogenase-like beta-hydroxyacid dehydrogenase